MQKKWAIYCLSVVFCFSVLNQGCTIIPKKTKDNIAAFDNSSPPQYPNKQNGGFLGFNTDGKGILTINAHIKYNNLIDLYKNTFYKEKGVKLEKEAGITPFVDNFGNNLYLIDEQYLTYFVVLNQWLKSGKQKD